jgi:HD domain.
LLEKAYQILVDIPINKERLIELFPILKELDEMEFYHPAHCYGVLEHSINAAETLNDIFLRLVLIFHDVGKLTTAIKVPDLNSKNSLVTKFPNHQLESVKIAEEIFKKCFDEKTLVIFLKLIEYHDTPLLTGDDDQVMRSLVEDYGTSFVSNLLKVQRADMSTHTKEYYERKIKPSLDMITAVYEKKYIINKQG